LIIEERIKVRQDIVSKLQSSKRPLVFFPEGWDTNGKVAILQFQKFLFSLGVPVIPAALRVYVPFVPIESNILGSHILREVFWSYFAPFTIFEIKFFDIEVKQDEESEIQFAKRVQTIIARELNLIASDYSYKTALQLRKRILLTTNINPIKTE